ncbi:lipase member I-like isoform X2 [Cimex lectularius]|uniref:Lipase domain-containing protein n=1 Tax=Cimex lectularius TaxID=79782 RepID=A0A8I6RPI4_CIMLE|nr:lipase member I-like isoform X2 [Cimex lectularius]
MVELNKITYFAIFSLYFLSSSVSASCISASVSDEPFYVARKMTFHLYTRNTHTEYTLHGISGLKKKFSSEKLTKILVHGWHNGLNSTFVSTLHNAYLERYDANVIVVDWSKYASCYNYLKSKESISAVGKAIAFMIMELEEKTGLNLNRTHMIGFSLGAHVSGIAGMFLKSGRLFRITGLDPAGPFFSIENLFMLNKDSAQFVDVIHTSMRAAGTRYKLGHVDFYPNGGTSGFNVLRSHRDAYEYFSESIANKRKFLAKRCESWAHFKSDNCPYFQFTDMGEYVSTERQVFSADKFVSTIRKEYRVSFLQYKSKYKKIFGDYRLFV